MISEVKRGLITSGTTLLQPTDGRIEASTVRDGGSNDARANTATRANLRALRAQTK
jgi:hypothetical protein